MMRIKLSKDILHDDRVCGKESVIDMVDEGRAKYLVDMLWATKTTDDVTIFPPLPPHRKPMNAEDVANAFTDALRKGLQFPVKENA